MSARVTPVEYDVDEGKNGKPKPIAPDEPKTAEEDGPGWSEWGREVVSFGRRHTGLFATSQLDSFKDKVRRTKNAPAPYNVHDRYYKTGYFQAVAKHPYFENITLTVIVINALWISIDTDLNNAETINKAEPLFVTADIMFFTYFTLELFIRFCAFEKKRHCMRDGWFVFDSILVALYAFDPFALGIMAEFSGGGGTPFPTSVLRLFRLARLSRLVRMLRSVPQLMIMIKGMVTAIGTVGYAIFLLLVITYVFAIALVNLVPDDNPLSAEPFDGGFFSGVLEAGLSLIVYATFLDNLADFVYACQQNSLVAWFLVWIYIILAALTVMNMLIGVLCNVIDAVAEEENESMMVDRVHEKFGAIVKQFDRNMDGFLSWKEFQELLGKPEAIAAVEEVNVQVDDLIDVAEDFFFDDGQPIAVSFGEFMDMLLDLRTSEEATVKHVLSMSKAAHSKFLKLYPKMDNLEGKLGLIEKKIDEKIAEKLAALSED